MADPQTDVIDAGHEIIVLSFRLLDAEVTAIPQQVATALTDPATQAAIKKTLLDFAKSRGTAAETVVSGEDAQKLVESLGKGVYDAASKKVLDQVKETAEYKRLEKSLESFKKAAASSNLGVWVDKNSTVLYIVGAALVVGTGTVLYVTRTGGGIVDAVTDPLKDKSFKILTVGAFSLSVGKLRFDPTAQLLGGEVSTVANWQKLKLELKLGVLAEGPVIQQIEGEAAVKSGPIKITLDGSAKPATHLVNLGLKANYEAGQLSVGVGAMYKDNLASATAQASYKTNVGVFGLQANVGEKQGGGVGYGGLATFTIPFK
ncbi:hypothetical protein [Prosthecomicrobium sp. N25]|uniref:hypothetical protein n=1 Tax=Prosthecomicrobium sp. N25 TaxID=3129254 RepID=UPI003076F26D